MALAVGPVLLPFLVVGFVLSERRMTNYGSAYIMLEGDCPGPSILFVRNSVQVSLTSNPLRYNQRARRRCSLAFRPQNKDHQLLLHWDALRRSDKGTKVILRGGRKIPTPGKDRPDFIDSDYMSYQHELVIHYIGYPHFDYFRVTVTETSPLMCGPGEFQCQRLDSFCISDELLCNGENNCGDANISDENVASCISGPVSGTTSRPTETPIPIGLVGALSAQPIIIGFLLIAFCIIRKRRQRSKRAAEVGSHLQRGVTSSRPRSQNEYVTLPRSSAGNQHKEADVTGDVTGDVSLMRQRLDRAVALISVPHPGMPRETPPSLRALPATPAEPEVNYMNLRETPQLPLLFEVPDTNSVPLLHTICLRKAAIGQSAHAHAQYHPEVCISEPGYMEIADSDVSLSHYDKDQRTAGDRRDPNSPRKQ